MENNNDEVAQAIQFTLKRYHDCYKADRNGTRKIN